MRTFSYEAIWKVVRRIPHGKVASYGQVASLAGLPGQARFAGYALHRLPQGFPVPWHRVLNARGCVAFPPGSASAIRQQRLLEKEGIRFTAGKVDLARFGWRPRQKKARGASGAPGRQQPSG